MTAKPGKTPRRRFRPPTAGLVSVVAGVLVFVVIMVAGVVLSSSNSTIWRARASALVIPSKSITSEQLPGYYETLSRGQMVATIAELVRLNDFKIEAANELGLTESQRQSVEVAVTVVADTAVLQVVATSEDRNLAIAMVDGVMETATRYVGDLVLPYAVVPVSSGASNVVESGLSTPMVLAVFALVAGVAGLAVQQAVHHLAIRRGPGSAERPPGSPDQGQQPGSEVVVTFEGDKRRSR